jgi:hypothetical protein
MLRVVPPAMRIPLTMMMQHWFLRQLQSKLVGVAKARNFADQRTGAKPISKQGRAFSVRMAFTSHAN